PIRTFDAVSNSFCHFRLFLHAEPSDNPMQSEECSHVGAMGNLPCHKCQVGGSQKSKEEDVGYHALFHHVSDKQMATGIKDKLAQHAIERLLAQYQTMKKKHPEMTRDAIAHKLQRWVDKHGFDPHENTPIELLHTILLGIVKYIRHMSHTGWKDAEKAIFAVLLRGSEIRASSRVVTRQGLSLRHKSV
ncbi:hypothetical protein BKA93DRAFT_740746, partial [Sparassis latifolia]